MLGWQQTERPVAEVESPVAEVRRPADLAGGERAPVAAGLAALKADHRRECSVQIAAALYALTGGKTVEIEAALADLRGLIADSPLLDLPAGQKAAADQQQEAAAQ